MGLYCWTFERIKTGKIVGAGVRWHGICCKTKSQWGNRWLVEASLPSEQKPILPPTDQLRSLLTLPNSLSSSRARMRTSSGSYLSVWRYPCFYLEREGPQDYASGVAIRSFLNISSYSFIGGKCRCGLFSSLHF